MTLTTPDPKTTQRQLLDLGSEVIAERARLEVSFRRRLRDHTPQSRYEQISVRLGGSGLDDAAERAVVGDTYNYLPYLFWPLFPEVPTRVVFEVAVAGRLYADYLIDTDHAVDGDTRRQEDGPVTPDWVAALKREFLLTESLGRLHGVFPAGSPFWSFFRTAQDRFAAAMLTELEADRFLVPDANVVDALKGAAAGKSSMADCAPAALAIWCDRRSDLEGVLSSLAETWLAVQLVDDFKDWHADLRAGRLTYLLAAWLAGEGQTFDEAQQLPPRELKRRFYRSQAVRDRLSEALTMLRQATACVPSSCSALQLLLSGQQQALEQILRDLDRAVSRARRLSRSDDGSELGPVEAATTFVALSQDEEGPWRSFMTSAGEATGWVTAYIGAMLADGGLAPEATRLAASWLDRERTLPAGWGYSKRVPVDADSTAHAIRFLTTSTARDGRPYDISADVDVLLRHQQRDGGFSTFHSPDEIGRIVGLGADSLALRGWLASQPCVTAAVAGALTTVMRHAALSDEGGERTSSALRRTVAYLLDERSPDGSWPAYWWHGGVYTTSFALDALTACLSFPRIVRSNRGDVVEAITDGHAWLIAGQRQDGAWAASPDLDEPCPFMTGLALRALTAVASARLGTRPGVVPPGEGEDRPLRRGATFLENTQLTNGSWRAGPLMHLRAPEDPSASGESHPRRGGTTLGATVSDHSSLFTTATALAGLHRAHAACAGRTQELP